jgi:hypothetical protein
LQQLIDRFQIKFDTRKCADEIYENHIYQKLNNSTTIGINYDGENA